MTNFWHLSVHITNLKKIFDVICVKKSVSLICQNGWRFFLSLDIFVDYDNAYIKLFSIELEKSGAFGRKYLGKQMINCT